MHIDWLTIRQQYQVGTIPDYGAGTFITLDQDGCLEWQTRRRASVEGSWSTTCQVRSFAGVVEWSGNPSRWGRPDNVFGHETMQSALGTVNRIMRELGLPEFTAGVVNGQRQRDDGVAIDGAILTRVDWCRNYAAGDDWSRVMRALEQQQWHGTEARRYAPGSLQWGSRRYRLFKWYVKAQEMRRHRLPKHTSVDDAAYRDSVIQWAESVGLLRCELSMGRDALRANGMRSLIEYDEEEARKMFDAQIDRMMPGTMAGGLSDVYAELVTRGIGVGPAHYAQSLAYAWAAGEDVFGQIAASKSTATAYRYRAMLKSVGIDIRQPVKNVTALTVQPRVAMLKPLTAPAWYRRAA